MAEQQDRSEDRGKRGNSRLASSYFLGFAVFGVVLMLWYRGLLRPLLPVLVIVGIALVVLRVIKAIKAPVD